MKRYIAIIIGILAILVVFFLPFGIQIDLGPGPNSLLSMVWEIPLDSAWYSIRFFSAFQYHFEFCFFRLFFLLSVILLIIGRYNKNWFISIGAISELIPLLLSIPALFILNSQGDNLFAIIFPIPFLIVFDLSLVFLTNRLNFNDVNKKIYNNNLKQKVMNGLI